jgi:glycosyltransferase involved in cell wall biosynthesis
MADHDVSDDPTPSSQSDDHRAPMLSVTVLNYNYAHYLPQCLDSILRQTWTDFELLLINDCSTDNSLEVIQPYLADPRVRLVNHEQNKGYIASLIEGSEMSRGKYITVISADDYCVSDRAFESLLQLMDADAGVAFAYSANGVYTDDGSQLYIQRQYPDSFVHPGVEQYRDLLLRGNNILHSGVFIRATAYRAIGGYEPTARFACDTVMWLMLCSQGKVAYSADELYAYRQHGTNMSFSKNGLRGGLEESLDGIRRSFAIMRKVYKVSDDLYVRGIKRYLSGVSEGAVFGGELKVGWYFFWCALRIHPVWTVFQARTPIIVARTLLGAHGYQALRSLLRSEQASLAHA